MLLFLYQSYPTDNCLGPGFTQTIPAQQEWWQYSTTVLKPGDAAVYSSLSFACDGTLQSLAIPFLARGSVYRYLNQYLYIGVSVWRFNETGYYLVGEFQGGVWTTTGNWLELLESQYLQNTVVIYPQTKILANDILAFRLPRPSEVYRHAEVYRHLPFLFKPGPSPGAFIPIVSVNFTASSRPITGEECTYTYTFLLALNKELCNCL